MENSLVLVKPDGVQRGLTGEIISRMERKGLKIVGMKMLQMDEALARRHYAIHEGKAFFDDLVSFIISGPIVAIVFQGKNAVEIVRQIVGATDPAKADAGTIRGDFGVDIGHNLVHGSDSLDNASNEVDLFFSREEILAYKRDLDRWVY